MYIVHSVFGSGSVNVFSKLQSFVHKSGFMIKMQPTLLMWLTTHMYPSILVLIMLLRLASLANKDIVEIVLDQGIIFNSSECVWNNNFGKSCLRILY